MNIKLKFMHCNVLNSLKTILRLDVFVMIFYTSMIDLRDPRLLLPIKKCPAIKSPSSSPTKTSIMTSKPASLEAEAASKTIATDPKVPEPGGVPTITQNLWLESPFFSASIRDAGSL